MTDGRNKVLKIVSNGEVTARECLICKEVKPLSEFGKNPSGYLGKRANCKTCHNDKVRDYNREIYRSGKNKPSRILNTYGITLPHVIKTLADQHGLCANRGCGKEISMDAPRGAANRANIDHDHVTGKFRALLCTPCNLHLGKLEKNRNQTLGLLEYITKHA